MVPVTEDMSVPPATTSNQASLIAKDLPSLPCSVAGMLLPEALSWLLVSSWRMLAVHSPHDHSLPSVSPYLAALIHICPSSPPSSSVLTERKTCQGLVKLTLLTHKTNCYFFFPICQAAEVKNVKPRVRVNIRSTVILACLSSKQVFVVVGFCFVFKTMV